MTRGDRNKEVVEAYVTAFNSADFGALKSLFAPDAQIQGVLGSVPIEKAMGIWRQLNQSFGIQLTIEEIIAEGDLVAVRYIERGVFRAPFMETAPTGKSYELVAMEWFTVRDGLIQNRWGARDFASQARQVGLPLG